jgi:hypothetical protein
MSAACPVSGEFQTPFFELRIMHDELSDWEWSIIRPMLLADRGSDADWIRQDQAMSAHRCPP